MTTTYKPLNKLYDGVIALVGDEFEHTEELQKLFEKEAKALRKSKKNKDPNRPKRARSAYIFYCKEHRGEAKADKPTEVTQELSKMWDGFKERVKKGDKKAVKEMNKYQQMVKKDKERYDSQMKDYTPPVQSSDDEKTKGKRKKKPADAPKRALSAYQFWSKDARPKIVKEHPEAKAKDVMKLLGEAWKKVPEKKRAPYQKKANADKERYNKAMEEYKKTHATTASATSSKSTPRKPRGPNMYTMYCRAHRDTLKKEHPKWSAKQVSDELNKRWKAMTDAEKASYKPQEEEKEEESEEVEAESSEDADGAEEEAEEEEAEEEAEAEAEAEEDE